MHLTTQSITLVVIDIELLIVSTWMQFQGYNHRLVLIPCFKFNFVHSLHLWYHSQLSHLAENSKRLTSN